jgi:tripartite ATP-independent transporter DctP family solute receptor
MPTMNLTRRPILGSFALAGALALGAGPALAQTQITFQHPIGINSHYGAGTTAFKETFERLTNNRFRVVYQRNDNERETIEAVQIGTIECTITSTGPVGNFVPETRNFDVPFLFRDTAHARGVLDSQIGQDMLARFPARGIVAVAWLENGFRHMTNSRREINTPADVRGLKVRTMENPVHMRAFQTLGAMPTPMAFSELVPALQQGTVDGQENPIPVILNNNLNQVQRHLTLTGHVYSPAMLLCNPAFVGRLNAADRAAFVQAGRDAAVANRARVTQDDQNGVEELRRRGMTVVTQVDTAAFQAALQPGTAQIESGLDGALISRIRAWRPAS